MKELAIHGGTKVRKNLFPKYRTIGKEEITAVTRVLKSGVLSKYIGAWHPDFYGGPEVQALEREWSAYFKCKYAIAVNSATSGLIAAVGAAGIGPKDEVIVTPYSMSISATAPLFYGARVVFADIEPEYFCLDPKSIEEKITPRTKAIIVVDLFGQSYDARRINAIAKKHGLIVIEDASQAPGGMLGKKYAGTLGDIGIFSLNYHKHIHCGEGGVVVTNNKKYAERVQLIRNHAESVVEGMGIKDLTNMIGHNFRMTEMEAAVTRQQLRKLNSLVQKRIRNAATLQRKLRDIPFLRFPRKRKGARHVVYAEPMLFDEKKAGVSRDAYVDAVKAELMPMETRESEGVKMSNGYVKPIYWLPLFRQKPYSYKRGTCPVVERLYEKELLSHELFHPDMTTKDLEDVAEAFKKVAQHIDELKK